MQQKAFSILKISDWILKLAYLNALFIAFSFLGCLIGGVFPATTAMLTVIRKWLMGDTEIPIFSTFWVSYKKDFLRSNLLGYILTFIGFTLFMYYLLLNQTVSEVAVWLRYPLVIITIIYIVFLLYVFPVFVHYEMKIPQILKTTFLIMSVSPLSTIMLIAAGIILYFTMSNFPGLIPLFGGSLIGFIVMWSSYLAFSHLKRKEEKTVVLD
ncbi:YesL family protein [Ectobacillus funiculus]|uniref:YesL family protein n=1 Tax=Ectobacillus funiculus TaxID=137993 RepID=UPI00101DA628|nr:YesL family protein [Ectobacillus funiculus]